MREKWTGPKLRFNESYIDVGKALEYQKSEGTAYIAFRPLCKIWIYANGLN